MFGSFLVTIGTRLGKGETGGSPGPGDCVVCDHYGTLYEAEAPVTVI
jgi:hypothetical protein